MFYLNHIDLTYFKQEFWKDQASLLFLLWLILGQGSLSRFVPRLAKFKDQMRWQGFEPEGASPPTGRFKMSDLQKLTEPGSNAGFITCQMLTVSYPLTLYNNAFPSIGLCSCVYFAHIRALTGLQTQLSISKTGPIHGSGPSHLPITDWLMSLSIFIWKTL